MSAIDSTAVENGGIGLDARIAQIAAAHERLRAAAGEISEEAAREAVDCPGWTRGHVLIHFADLSRALARQARFAAKGETIEVYEGGRPARDRRIEELHDRPVQWLREQVNEGLTELEEAWSALPADGWGRPSQYRNLPLFATQLAWWREVELHTVDLLVGYRSEDWSAPLASHTVSFLRSRLPPGVTLVASDTGQEWSAGDSASVVVRGELRAWLPGSPDARTARCPRSTAVPPCRNSALGRNRGRATANAHLRSRIQNG